MTNPFSLVQGMTPSRQTQVRQTKTATPAYFQPLDADTDAGSQKNPFMIALKSDSQAFMDMYGQNRPLEKPMFFGYRGEKPLYVGSRLFVLY